ncbi:MAG: hypothetical protein ABIR87_08485 [Sphingomicrobium sp.]
MNDVSIGDVVGNPEWLPHAYDAAGQTLTLVNVPRAARAQLMFLFDQHYGGQFAKASFAGKAVAAALAADSAAHMAAPLHFIFHTSFSGSSLLAKALELPGVASSMREPAIFTNLANRMNSSDGDAAAARLELVLKLIERPLAAGEKVIAKQSSFANRLAGQILETREQSRAVLLFSDVDTYLISLLKRGMWGRIWGRKLFINLKGWSTLKLKLDLKADELVQLTDMQAAALAWLMQVHHFHELATRFGPRVMLLHSDQLFTAQAASLHRVMTLFDFGLTELDASDIATGPIFAKHSKFADKDYSVEDRISDTATVGEAHAEELAMVTKWIAAVADHHGVALRPSA